MATLLPLSFTSSTSSPLPLHSWKPPQPPPHPLASSSMGCCFCRKKSFVDPATPSLLSNFFFHSAATHASNFKADDANEGRFRSSGWKRLLRKLKSEAKKMNCTRYSPGFQYDSLSYAMNFDDGCLQHCDSYRQSYMPSAPFPPPPAQTQAVTDFINSKRKRQPASVMRQDSLPLWQRRKSTQSPVLDLTSVRHT